MINHNSADKPKNRPIKKLQPYTETRISNNMLTHRKIMDAMNDVSPLNDSSINQKYKNEIQKRLLMNKNFNDSDKKTIKKESSKDILYDEHNNNLNHSIDYNYSRKNSSNLGKSRVTNTRFSSI